uniref:H(+)-exporting diphosphatase n=1 Tax=Eutreptiella gymnastica TaxID=73025 RepID=A0A7S1N541_9EUGL
MALYAAFLTLAYPSGHVAVNVVDPRTLIGLMSGAMLPYWFAAQTLTSVDRASVAMVKHVTLQLRQLDPNSGDLPEYAKCVKVVAKASFQEAAMPVAVLALVPIVWGILFGKESLAGLLPGAIISSLQVAVSASSSGAAWKSAREYIELEGLGARRATGSPEHTTAIIAGQIGDTMKDTYGPSIQTVVKLMAMVSIVFIPVFTDPRLGGILTPGWLAKDK